MFESLAVAVIFGAVFPVCVVWLGLAELKLYGYFDAPQRPSDLWYTAHGFERGPGESWEDLDSRPVTGKRTTLWQEYVADTDPNDTNSVFRVIAVDPGPPVVMRFLITCTLLIIRLIR
ncbi:MAG: hypothetical protein WC340_16910 [Kiritimatiellia bacterium]